MVMLRRWTILKKENHHYGGGQFKGGSIVKLQRWSV